MYFVILFIYAIPTELNDVYAIIDCVHMSTSKCHRKQTAESRNSNCVRQSLRAIFHQNRQCP